MHIFDCKTNFSHRTHPVFHRLYESHDAAVRKIGADSGERAEKLQNGGGIQRCAKIRIHHGQRFVHAAQLYGFAAGKRKGIGRFRRMREEPDLLRFQNELRPFRRIGAAPLVSALGAEGFDRDEQSVLHGDTVRGKHRDLRAVGGVDAGKILFVVRDAEKQSPHGEQFALPRIPHGTSREQPSAAFEREPQPVFIVQNGGHALVRHLHERIGEGGITPRGKFPAPELCLIQSAAPVIDRDAFPRIRKMTVPKAEPPCDGIVPCGVLQGRGGDVPRAVCGQGQKLRCISRRDTVEQDGSIGIFYCNKRLYTLHGVTYVSCRPNMPRFFAFGYGKIRRLWYTKMKYYRFEPILKR